MNLVSIPYHDWRKIEAEGKRTRDSHLVSHFSEHPGISKVLVINRPTSLLEIIVKRKNPKLTGEVCLSRKGLKLYKINEKLYILDYVPNDVLAPIRKKKLWFFDSFGNDDLIAFYRECLEFLGFKKFTLLTNNIYSITFVRKTNHNLSVFDAYDNLLYFPGNKDILGPLTQAYKDFVNHTRFWTTNSTKNLQYYREHYNQNKCFLVKNGVDLEVFERDYPLPEDMKNIKNPIFGFGGKITHLFDFELFNYCVDQHPEISFVLVGQILDKEVFEKISKRPNVHYLGDKSYDIYPSYVCNFNVGIIPYVTNNLESGVDSIKVYEYIAAGLSAVGTNGAGMPDVSEYVFIAKDKFEFAGLIQKALQKKDKPRLPETHTWSHKVDYMIELFEQTQTTYAG